MITYMVLPARLDLPTHISQCSFEESFDVIRIVVGGWIELVRLEFGDMYINEEGKIDGLPVNARASQLAWTQGAIAEDDCIVGNAILFGKGNEFGEETSITPECRAWLLQQLGAHA